MKTFTQNTAKTLGMGFLLIGIAPLLPLIALMHLIALSCDESTGREKLQNQLANQPEPITKPRTMVAA